MNVIDLTKEHHKLYFVCLEDWSETMKQAGEHKELWFNQMKDKGLGVKLAVDNNGEIGGMIQYIPIEYSYVSGNDLYFILCIWVHNYNEGRGNFEGKGLGTALLEAAEDDVKRKGKKGMVSWGMTANMWMKASWYEKHGYSKVDKLRKQLPSRTMLWKPFTEDAKPPKWIQPIKKPEPIPDKVVVTAFMNMWCPGQNRIFELAKKAASEFGDKVVFREINTFNRDNFLEWGISYALFIDEKQMRIGPPPHSTLEIIRNAINDKVNDL
jgi:GNAT superfamily N-acetyltransferase